MSYSIIGIDFGTSTTVVKVRNYLNGEIEECKTVMFNGLRTIPTLIFETENGNLKFGKDAESLVANHEKGKLHDNFKMRLLDLSQIEETRQLILKFFIHLYQTYNEQQEGLNVQEKVSTVISFPAKWIPENRTLMKECASEAGFPNVDGLDEPTAAIRRSLAPRTLDLSTKGYLLPNHKYNVFLIDMGAGTTDIAIFTLKAGVKHTRIEKIITYPHADASFLCGGREIDAKLQDFLYDYLLDEFNGNENAVRQMVDNMQAIKTWKEISVSPTLQKTQPIALPSFISTYITLFDSMGVPHKEKDFKIERSEFEALTKQHWTQWDSLIKEALLCAKKEIPSIKGAESIDFVIATGGHSLWYGVREYFMGQSFSELMPPDFAKLKEDEVRFIQEEFPQETVAEGLTYDDSVATINPIFGNGFWMKVDIEGNPCEYEQVLSASDPIPTSVTKNMLFNVSSNLFRIKDISFVFSTAFGSQLETALKKDKVVKVPLPDVVTNYIIGILLGGPLGAAAFLAKVALMGWEAAFSSAAHIYAHTFKIKLSTTFDVHKDGTICVKCVYKIDDSTPQEFTVNY